MDTFLDLLAKIKWRIFPYQFNIWYESHDINLIFPGCRLCTQLAAWACERRHGFALTPWQEATLPSEIHSNQIGHQYSCIFRWRIPRVPESIESLRCKMQPVHYLCQCFAIEIVVASSYSHVPESNYGFLQVAIEWKTTHKIIVIQVFLYQLQHSCDLKRSEEIPHQGLSQRALHWQETALYFSVPSLHSQWWPCMSILLTRLGTSCVMTHSRQQNSALGLKRTLFAVTQLKKSKFALMEFALRVKVALSSVIVDNHNNSSSRA